jgi:glucose-1-phosphate thymidylyltransferase
MSRSHSTDAIADAVILAGGEGKRLRPLTENRPKPMLPAANRPILEYVFDALLASGITTLHVVVGYQRERVQDYFGATYRGVPIRYHRQSKQLGSGHALQQVAGDVPDQFLAVNGDQLTEPRMIADVIEAHATNDARATLGVVASEEAPCYGSVELDGDTVTTFVERSGDRSHRLLNAGVYGFDETIFEALDQTARDEGTLEIPAVISTLIEGQAPVEGVRTDGYWMDATYPWDLLTVTRRLLAEEMVVTGTPSDESTTTGEPWDERVRVATDAVVHEAAIVQPPVVVSSACEVGPGAVVGPYTALGPNVTVDANTVISESVIGEDTRIGPNSTVTRTVTGQSVHLGPEVVVPSGVTDVCIDGTVHPDQRFGAVIADRVHVVGDAGFAPGSLVGPNATVGLGARIDGTVDAGLEVRR